MVLESVLISSFYMQFSQHHLLKLLSQFSRSFVSDFATPWTIESMKFSRPEYWSGHPFPSPGDLPNPGIKLRSPTLQADSLPSEPQGKLIFLWYL